MHPCRKLAPFFLLPVLLLSLVALGSPSHADTPTYPGLVAIPYTSGHSGIQFITGVVNNKISATFMLDTGTNYSSITDDFAKRLRLGYLPTHKAEQDRVVIPLLTFGGLRFTRATFLVYSAKQVPKDWGQTIDGVIGANVLRSSPALFDFQKHQITFFPHSPTADDLKQVGMADAYAVTVQDKDNNNLYRFPVKLTNADKSVDAMMMADTGSDHTQIPFVVANQLGLQPLGQGLASTYYGKLPFAVAAISSVTFGPVILIGNPSSATVPSVTVGPVTFLANNILVSYVQTPTELQSREFEGIKTGLLGCDLLSHFRVLFDYAGDKIYFQGIDKPSPSGSLTP